MSTFEYSGYAVNGTPLKGWIEASDLKQAREKLTRGGVFPERIIAAGAQSGQPGWWRRQGLSLGVRAQVYDELSSLLQAGFPLVTSLDMLIQSHDLAHCRRALIRIRGSIQEGAALSQALDTAQIDAGDHEKAVIASGERSGALAPVMTRLAAFLDAQSRLRERIITAFTYPSIVFVVAIGIASGLLGVAVPRLGKLLEETHVPLPVFTRLIIRVGGALSYWGLPLLATLLLAGAGIAYLRLRNPERRQQFSRLCFSLPLIGSGCAIVVNLRFAQALSLLLAGGVSLIEALRLAGASTGNRWVAQLTDIAAEEVRHGAGLADALCRVPPLSGALLGWIRVGETGGSLAESLDHASIRFQHQWERFLDRRLAVLEPLLIMLLGIFVLAVVLAIMMPIMTVNQSLSIR